MDEIKLELTDEQREQLRKSIEEINEKLRAFAEIMGEIIAKILEWARYIAEQLGRFFLKQQLLEWRVPLPVADFISQKIYWFWAFKLGFNWFERKMAMIE